MLRRADKDDLEGLMKTALILLAALGLAAAGINMNEITKDPSTKGWGVGLGFLAFIGFGWWAIVS